MAGVAGAAGRGRLPLRWLLPLLLLRRRRRRPFCSWRGATEEEEEEEEGGVTLLQNSRNGAKLYLLGTCHASHSAALRASKIELCKNRAMGIMENWKSIGAEDFARLPGDTEQKILTLAAQHMEDAMCIDGVKPGEEFKVAIEEGRRVGARIACIDEDFHDTMRKVRNALPTRGALSCLPDSKEVLDKYPNYFQSLMIGDPRDRAKAMVKPVFMREALAFYNSYFPEATKVLLHDRNELMTKHLRSFEGRVVAVVGMLHVRGITELWEKAEL